MYYAAGILLIWLLCLLSVLLHELGHALGYRLTAGKVKWTILAGSGPRILSTAKYTFCLIPAGGYFAPDEEPGTKKAILATLAGGPLASLLQTVLYCICHFCFSRSLAQGTALYEILVPVSRFLLFFNFFQFFFTIIPIRYRVVCRGSESDGLLIVRALKHERTQQQTRS